MIGVKPHQNRRMYRGKARDGRIPSKSIQRKKKTKAESTNYDNSFPSVVPVYADVPDAEGSQLIVLQEMSIHEPQMKQKDVGIEHVDKDDNSTCTSDHEKKILQEIKHVRKRITNLQEAIQLSPSMASPEVWKENCLNAVLNCVNEWRNIVSYHGSNCSYESDESDHGSNQNEVGDTPTISIITSKSTSFCMHPENEWSKETSRNVFGLIQMSLQTGPLRGSNAGYFKRCGSEVAMMAKQFLDVCIGNNPQEQLRFTSRQNEILKKWLKDATKAVDAKKPPSKSASKVQADGDKNRKR